MKVMLISPLPPPPGGIATWTEKILKKGLRPPFTINVVDTKVYRKHFSDPSRFDIGEIVRTSKIIFKMIKGLCTRQYCLVHLNCSLSRKGMIRDVILALLARVARVPYVFHLHGNFVSLSETGALGKIYDFCSSLAIRNAGAVFALNSASYAKVLESGGSESKSYIIPNFVDSYNLPEPEFEKDTSTVFKGVFVGTLTKLQGSGIEVLIKITKSIEKVNIDVVGTSDRNIRKRLEGQVKEEGLSGKIKFLGEISNDQVLELMNSSDFYIFPSPYSEGFTVSVVEAMGIGLPIVATPVGAMADMVDVGKGGYLVEPSNYQGFVDSVNILNINPETRRDMAAYNRAKSADKYEYSVVTNAMCEVYQRILAENE